MDYVWFVAVPLLTAFLIGSLPLGAWLVRTTTGFDPREVNPHLLGVENVARLVGGWVALGSFALDMFKGAISVVVGTTVGSFAAHAVGVIIATGTPELGTMVLPALLAFEAPSFAPGNLLATAAGTLGPLAVAAGSSLLGGLLGHLFPLRLVGLATLPRGRGNGVLLGGLAGLYIFGALPFWALGLPVAIYAGLLAATRYVSLSSLIGVATLSVTAAAAAALGAARWDLAVLAALVVLLVLWRQKSALSRIKDGTEPRLGEPQAVRGLDADTALAAFLVHPLSLDDVWQPQSQRWLRHVLERVVKPGILPLSLLKRLFLTVRPQFQGVIEGVTLADGRKLRIMLISAPLLPDQFRSNPDDALRLAVQGARFAHELGAEVVGLGAFWSTVGDKGEAVQREVPEIVVTNGGAYTAATVKAAVPGLLRRFAAQGVNLASTTAAVVGANGVVAFGVARMIAPEVGRLLLIGRDKERLNRSAATLRKKYPTTEVIATTDLLTLATADLIFTATSDPDPVIYPQHVKPGAWIYDLGRPADVDDSVRDVPGVELVPGGIVRPPGAMRTRIDLRFGEGYVPACLAETMILTATKAYDRRSLGAGTKTKDIAFYLREGERLGFEIVTRDTRMAEVRVKV
ncbi:MAG TPA: glycerol-3-phosphate acyltransferase [Trueperaceae bacterium]|nr:glycerol-3-phosphate acyltransferase [Trueperaceae bacterium]